VLHLIDSNIILPLAFAKKDCGAPGASTPDNNLTSQLKKGCEAIGIQLLDHIILTEDAYLSYMDEGML